MSGNPPAPYPHQTESVPFLTDNRAILADPPGLGKSRSALMAAQGQTLIVAPASLEEMWKQQVSLFRPELDVAFVSYNKLSANTPTWDSEERKIRYPHNGKARAELSNTHWDCVIADEAHHLKGHKTKWTLAFENLVKDTGQVTMLTGTLLPNWGHEAYMALRLIYGPKDKRTSSYWRWVQTWFQMRENRFSGKMSEIGDLHQHLTWDIFAGQFDGHYMTRPENSVELPHVTHVTVPCRMHPAQAKAYQQMKKELLADIGPETIISWHPGAAHTMLLKMSTGLDSVSQTRASGKLDAVEEIMHDRGDDPTVFFVHYRASAEAIAARIPGCVTIHGGYTQSEREVRIADWKQGKYPHIVATYGTLAEGQTLVRSNCVMRVEAHHRPSTMDQARKRTDRIGQERPGFLYDFVSLDTVDVRLRELLATKTDQQMAVYKALECL